MTARQSYLKRRYGMTEQDYARILRYQGGECGVCNRRPGGRKLHVDHDHKSGYIRGLLCFYCNKRMVGRHTVGTIWSVYSYLTEPPAESALGIRVVPVRKKRKRK